MIVTTPTCTIIPPLARPTSPCSPCLRGREEWHLTDHRGPNSSEAERDQGERSHVGTNATAITTTPRSRRATAAGGSKELTRRLAPGKRRCDRHEEEQRDADRHRHPVEIRAADRDALAVRSLEDEREDGAQEHDERDAANSTLLARKRGLMRMGESIEPGDLRRSARHPMSPIDPSTTIAEEGEDVRPDSGSPRTCAAESSTPDLVRNVPR